MWRHEIQERMVRKLFIVYHGEDVVGSIMIDPSQEKELDNGLKFAWEYLNRDTEGKTTKTDGRSV